MRQQEAAKGFSYLPDSPTVRIVVTVPRSNFVHMRARALAKRKSISAVIREYIEVGIEVDLDIEQDAA